MFWSAHIVYVLQEKLPEIFRAAYSPDDATAELKATNIWGVTLHPNTAASDARASVVLMKFLRAR